MMSPFWLKKQERPLFNFLSNPIFKTIINSYSYYDYNLICRLWESIVFCKKRKKNWKTNNDIVTLPSLALISQFLKSSPPPLPPKVRVLVSFLVIKKLKPTKFNLKKLNILSYQQQQQKKKKKANMWSFKIFFYEFLYFKIITR